MQLPVQVAVFSLVCERFIGTVTVGRSARAWAWKAMMAIVRTWESLIVAIGVQTGLGDDVDEE